jgi:hypothetical protein
MGLKFTTMGVLEAGVNHLQPRPLMQAYARGLQMSFDLLDPGWEFKAVLDQPISKLRQQYQLSPQPQVSLVN